MLVGAGMLHQEQRCPGQPLRSMTTPVSRRAQTALLLVLLSPCHFLPLLPKLESTKKPEKQFSGFLFFRPDSPPGTPGKALAQAQAGAAPYQQPVHDGPHLGWKQPILPPQVCLTQVKAVVDMPLALGAMAVAAVFFLCFEVLCFGAGFAVGAASAADAAEDGVGATSAAQAGTTIKANNSNIFFMVVSLPLWLIKTLQLA